jgi:hypothetical protein
MLFYVLLYLTTHPLLKQLADKFPGCVILASADDVHITAPPELAAAAYERWRFLYAALLQGELNDFKSKCYSMSQGVDLREQPG